MPTIFPDTTELSPEPPQRNWFERNFTKICSVMIGLIIVVLVGTYSISRTDANTPLKSSDAVVEPAMQLHGNRSSRIYHWPGCPNYDDIAAKNLVIFNSVKAAEAAGFRAAKNCPTASPTF